MLTACQEPASEAPAEESIFKPALLLMVGRTLAFAATFFIPVALVRIFTPEQFGTYKQLFLVFSTAFLISQLGMATTLYYFLPQAPQHAGKYVANSLLFLAGVGICCLGIVTGGAQLIARWLSNAQLAAYLPWIGIYTFCMTLSAPLEIVMISRRRYSWAATSYALSDLARAAALILPVLLFRQMEGLLMGAVAVALARVVVMVVCFRREFRGGLTPDRILLKQQLAYALPFSAAVLVEILQASIPQYVVSSMFNPAIFAIFAVGCLQIPLVDVAASPTSDVMMVRMQELLTAGRMSAVLEVWRDTTSKLALLFFPLAAFAIFSSREIIVLLFTRKYLGSVPIFGIWSAMIVLSAFQVDGVMRVFAQTRFLFALNIMRLVIIVALLRWSLAEFYLTGPVLVVLLANTAFKVAGLIRMRKLLCTGVTDLLPWQRLGSILAAACCGGTAAVAVESSLHLGPAIVLSAMGAAFVIVYAALVWYFGLVNTDEKAALTGWARRRRDAIFGTPAFGKG